ncbi:JAB domain-containing protein [Salinimicrobium catena]|uniref:JAB domain-containing protein n=1 Tax=Salinimicrobium catena TaxID=390640 RepID=UPI002FE4CC53
MKTSVNEISLRYQNTKIQMAMAPKINSSREAFNIFNSIWDQNAIAAQEHFNVMLLNNSNRVKGIFLLSSGGITATLVDIRILFAVVLKSLSTAVIIAHNHPSGALHPSTADKKLTEKIKNAGELLDIKLLDHLILTPSNEYYSFADEGLL